MTAKAFGYARSDYPKAHFSGGQVKTIAVLALCKSMSCSF
jgi:hypothetical protein